MLDNLVFYYDAKKYEDVVKRLQKLDFVLKVDVEITQLKDSVWKRYFGLLVTDPLQVFVNNFLSYGENAMVRLFPLQVHWFNFINMSLEDVEKLERKELNFVIDILSDVEVERWHFELTMCLSHSKKIYEEIIKPLENKGWSLLQLQPDPQKILQRNKFLLWHLADSSRKIYLKGYVTNNETKYPKCFRNMTKVELVLPFMDFNRGNAMKVLELSQRIRKIVVNNEARKEGRRIVWAKAIQEPQLFVWFNTSSALDLIRFTQKNVYEDVAPYPYAYITQEEAINILEEQLEILESKNEQKEV